MRLCVNMSNLFNFYNYIFTFSILRPVSHKVYETITGHVAYVT